MNKLVLLLDRVPHSGCAVGNGPKEVLVRVAAAVAVGIDLLGLRPVGAEGHLALALRGGRRHGEEIVFAAEAPRSAVRGRACGTRWDLAGRHPRGRVCVRGHCDC